MSNDVEILIVEDSPTQALQLQFILEAHGYRTNLRPSGEQALTYLADHKPGLVISAVVLPGMDGYQFCKRIKTNESFRHIPVILLTSLSKPRDLIKGLAAGADNFVIKSTDWDTLLGSIPHLLAEVQAGPETETPIFFITGESTPAMTTTANKAAPELLAAMNHELRTPLNAILGFAQVMARSSTLSSEHQDHLNIIIQNGEHLLAMINDILAVSKGESARIVKNENKLDPHQMNLIETGDSDSNKPARRVVGLAPGQPRYRLLIADDSPTNRFLLASLLEPLDFEIQEAANGQEAIKTWEAWLPHLICLDMQMPLMDGYETARRIKTTVKGQSTVILALTASALEEEEPTALAAGCNDFLRKPFRESELFEMLAKHLGVRYRYEDGEAGPAQIVVKETTAAIDLPAELALLPPELPIDLEQATTRLDLEMIAQAINQIRAYQPALADALALLANDFDFDEILTVIQTAQKQHD